MNDHQMPTDSNRLERKIDALTETVGQIKQELTGVKQDLAGVKQELGGVKEEMGEVKQGLGSLEKELRQVHVLAERTEQFTKDAWDSLESLRKNVETGFEQAKQEREQGFQLVHAAIRHWGEKVQRIEDDPVRSRNREL